MAPEMPAAMYSLGATTFPVWPTCRSLGCQPASTTAREAPTAALSTSASALTGLKSPFVPRPHGSAATGFLRSRELRRTHGDHLHRGGDLDRGDGIAGPHRALELACAHHREGVGG